MRILCALTALLCGGCALVQSPAERAHAVASSSGFVALPLSGAPLRAYLRTDARSGSQANLPTDLQKDAKKSAATSAPPRLTIYIESDGAPWPTATTPPYDPTPVKPLVLQMAAADTAAAVAYIGRPCQYLDDAALEVCDPALWTHGRFSESAVAATSRAVDQIKRAAGARDVALAGYSGGGAMAALVAARRDDVVCLVSVASPLDTAAWTRSIGVSSLRTSLNPAQFTDTLINVAQTHFTGNDDTVVPPATINSFVAPMKNARVVARAGADHDCCWVRDWRELLRQSCLDAG